MLNTDLFREEFLWFPDASKLQGHQTRLEWDKLSLYQLFVKRLANSGQEMSDYLQTVSGLIVDSHPLLGFLPSSDESPYQLLMETMVGKFMGSNPRKGYTYRWIPNHLQDTEGKIVPRSFLKLFSFSAEKRLDKVEELTESLLLKPVDLQAALMDVSQDRIRELVQEEYPWIEALKQSLKGNRVPMEKSKLLEILASTPWSNESDKKPPNSEPEEILQILIQLGILESRLDNRINMPEIYLYGFDVKRPGGIIRPQLTN
ncbi:MAG: hypothetical protein DSM107014_15100 [Gomphosphaeria aponina SAG 52.96 = DSM 107014]|uniref:Uncharacterized protein n=1 Tax=Gomphosphaeria aponina SAG 52.96 = DSM 107014 TaxID=1521640 RepID=A0A941GWK7_9CHRO|nr:hypothetical protein [Gomphosphaeria aponina SAG 52.96 = DSM 107014]